MWPRSNKCWEYEVDEMKKKLISRGLLGFPLGMAMGFAITVGISLWIGDGAYYPAVPELIHAMGTELNAVMCQSLLCGVLGSGFGMASLIWTIDSWSLAKQSGVYFSIVCVIMLPIAYAAHWMEHSLNGVLAYFALFAAIFAAVWIAQYWAWRVRVKRMNDRVEKANAAK